MMFDIRRMYQRLTYLMPQAKNGLAGLGSFAPKVGSPHRRSSDSYFRYALEELKFLRSFNDLKTFYQKMTYVIPRTTGSVGRFTKTPPSLQIEPTNYCNVSCVCCPTSRSSRTRGYIDLALFQRIIDDAAQVGVKRIHLYLNGEPLLHPQLVEMIRYVKLKDLALHLVTNGMLFSREKSEAILRSGVTSADHITFSILGYSKDVHEQVMRQVNHDQVVKNVLEFVELRRKLGVNGPIIATVFYSMPENEHEEEQFLEYWRGVVDHARLGGRISESYSQYKRNRKPVARTQTCALIWERMTIYWNGDVTLCGDDVDGDWIVGNLNDHSISDLWSSEQLLAIRQIHKAKRFEEFPLCAHCDM